MIITTTVENILTSAISIHSTKKKAKTTKSSQLIILYSILGLIIIITLIFGYIIFVTLINKKKKSKSSSSEPTSMQSLSTNRILGITNIQKDLAAHFEDDSYKKAPDSDVYDAKFKSKSIHKEDEKDNSYKNMIKNNNPDELVNYNDLNQLKLKGPDLDVDSSKGIQGNNLIHDKQASDPNEHENRDLTFKELNVKCPKIFDGKNLKMLNEHDGHKPDEKILSSGKETKKIIHNQITIKNNLINSMRNQKFDEKSIKKENKDHLKKTQILKISSKISVRQSEISFYPEKSVE